MRTHIFLKISYFLFITIFQSLISCLLAEVDNESQAVDIGMLNKLSLNLDIMTVGEDDERRVCPVLKIVNLDKDKSLTIDSSAVRKSILNVSVRFKDSLSDSLGGGFLGGSITGYSHGASPAYVTVDDEYTYDLCFIVSRLSRIMERELNARSVSLESVESIRIRMGFSDLIISGDSQEERIILYTDTIDIDSREWPFLFSENLLSK